MKTNTLSTSGTNPGVILLGILAALLIFAVLTGRKVPVLSTNRAALLGLIVIGLAICSQAGMGRVAAIGAWMHPFSIAGYLIGAAILVIGIAALFGKQIPPLTSDYQSFVVVVVLAATKVAIATLHRLIS